MHLTDIHFPFSYKGALNIAYQLIELVKPDVIVDGSDIGDFALVSKFDPDPDVEDETTDILDDFQADYAPHENMLTLFWNDNPKSNDPLGIGLHQLFANYTIEEVTLSNNLSYMCLCLYGKEFQLTTSPTTSN